MKDSPRRSDGAVPRVWPSSAEYSDAIQNPALAFSDSRLRDCRVTLNSIGMPAVWSGGFANVYQLNCPRTGDWAVKCFTRGPVELRERYQAISRGLAQANLPFAVEFRYLNEGIRTASGVFPIVTMRWVAGRNLRQFVADFVDQPRMLDQLLHLWIKLGVRLEAAGIAHGDLQHGNVLLIPRGDRGEVALRLIDYDGMYVPELAGRPSTEIGLAAYQHPARSQRPIYDAAIDRFSHLVICAAVSAVRYGGRRLWESFDDGENLLFRASDFTAPEHSALMRELASLQDADVRALAGRLTLAARRPHQQTPAVQDWAREGQVRPLSNVEQAEFVRILTGEVEPSTPTAALIPQPRANVVDAAPSLVVAVEDPGPRIVIDVGRSPTREPSRPPRDSRGVLERLRGLDDALARWIGPDNRLLLGFTRALVVAVVGLVPIAGLVALIPSSRPPNGQRPVASQKRVPSERGPAAAPVARQRSKESDEAQGTVKPDHELSEAEAQVPAGPAAEANRPPLANPSSDAPAVDAAVLPGAPRVIARLGRRMYTRRSEAFRAAVLRMPYVYVLDGNWPPCELVVFRIPDDYFSTASNEELFEIARIPDAGLPGALLAVDDWLITPGPRGLQIYSLEDPARPRRVEGVAEAPSMSGVTAMLRHDRTLYCLGQPSLRVFDLRDVTAPRELPKPSIQGHWNGCVVGDRLYLVTRSSRANDSSELNVFDLTKPESPNKVSAEALTLPGAAYQVRPAGEHHLVATSSGHAQTIDISDPLHPRPIRSHFAASGRTAVVHQAHERRFLVTGYEIHRIDETALERVTDSRHHTSQTSGYPYHGDTQGAYSVIPSDQHLLVLANPGEAQRRADRARNRPRAPVDRPTEAVASLPPFAVVDAPSLKPTKTISTSPSCLSFLPDRTRLLTGTGAFGHVNGKNSPINVSFDEWDVGRGEKIGTLKGHELPVGAIGVSSDGKAIATGESWQSDSDKPSVVRIWDAVSRRELRQVVLRTKSFFPHTIVFLGTSSRFAVAGHNSPVVQVFDAETGGESPPIEPPNGPVQALAVSADGQRIATSHSAAMETSRIAVWNATNGRSLKQRVFDANVAKGLAFSPDGTRLTGGFFDGSLWDWDWEANEVPAKRAGWFDQCVGLAFSADARRVVAAGYVPHELPSGKFIKRYVAYVLDWPEGRVRFQLEVPQPKGDSGWYPRVALSADGRAAALPTLDSKLSVWELP